MTMTAAARRDRTGELLARIDQVLAQADAIRPPDQPAPPAAWQAIVDLGRLVADLRKVLIP